MHQRVVTNSQSSATSQRGFSRLVLQCATRITATLLLLPILLGVARSQSDPAAGIQPFSTNRFGVDLATGNLNLSIPIRSKSTLSVSLVGNFHPYINPVSQGWLIGVGLQPMGSGLLGYYIGNAQLTRPIGCNIASGDLMLSLIPIVDSSGAQHPTGGQMDLFGCFPPPAVMAAIDHSGLMAVTGGSNNTATWKIYNTSGTYNGGNNTTTPDGVVLNSGPNVGVSGTYSDALTSTAFLTATDNGKLATSDTYSYDDASGTQRTITVSKTGYYQWTAFDCSGILDMQGSSLTYFPTTITTPTGTYTITYEQTPGKSSSYVTGRIASIKYPSGGSITYAYQGSNEGITCSGAYPPTLQITVNDGEGNNSVYKYTNASPTIIETDPAGNQTAYTFSSEYLYQAVTYEGGCPTSTAGCNGGGTLLRTMTTCYNGAFTNCGTSGYLVTSPITQTDVYTSFNGSASNLVETKFDSYENTTEVKQYDFGAAMPPSGNPVSDTINFYGQSWNGTACTAYPSGTYIYNTPCYSHTMNSSGTDVAKTQITYSNTGHPTSTAKWVSGSSWLTSTATFNGNGTTNIATDANGATSTYAYNGTDGCNSLLPTSVTAKGVGLPAGGLTTSTQWDCNGGVATSTTDPNNNTTTTEYAVNGVADPLYRPLASVDARNSSTGLSYSATTAESAMNFNGTISTSDQLTTIDGLGRQILSQKRQGQAPSITTFDSTQTLYSWTPTTSTVAGGPLTKTSMPYAGTAGQLAPTGTPLTSTQSDALGRPLTVTDGGGGTVSYTYTENDVLQTVGPTQNFSKQLEYDGLGRLTSVCEITAVSGSGSCGQSNPATGFLTKYTYDALGNLLTVTQNAQPNAIGGQQKRTYAYDGLSRLTSESNPESATTTYTYDSINYGGCSVANAGDLVLKTDAVGNGSCYVHDGLHRLLSIGQTSGSPYVTPNACFTYDSATVNGTSMPNAKLHLAEAYTTSAGCSATKITDEGFGYDPDGNPTDLYESTPHSGGYYHSVASYWPNGALETLGLLNNSGGSLFPTLTYGAEGEGRPSSVTAASGTNPVKSVTYTLTGTAEPIGSLTNITFPSLDSDGYQYDPNTGRMTKYTFDVDGQSLIGSPTWNPNGTLQKLAVTDPFNNLDNYTCNNTYDDLARISGNNCGSTWEQTFSYDPFGNITKTGSISWACASCYTPSTNQYNATLSNQISYDLDGNLLNDSFNHYTWDAYGNLAAPNGGAITYDALNRMVENNNGAFQFTYSPGGTQPLASFAGQTLQGTHIVLPGGAVANYNSSGVLAQYIHADWLGSAKLFSTPARAAQAAMSYAPFGEGYAGGIWEMQFTAFSAGYTLTDSENQTGSLADFTYRRYAPVQGRWISPDPAGLTVVNPSNPQSWNRYAYVLNNPLSLKDPLGLWCVWDDGSGHDDDESDGGVSKGACDDQGGHWDQYDTITNVLQSNGIVTQISYAAGGTSGTFSPVGMTLSGLDSTLQSYSAQNTTVSVSEYFNWNINLGGHLAFGVGNSTPFGLNPRSDAQFMRYKLSNLRGGPGVPGAVTPQVGGLRIETAIIPVAGIQAAIIQNGINQGIQNPPNYDIGGGPYTCDCASWPQEVLGSAGVNSGPPTQFPGVLVNQLNGLYP